MNVKLFSLQCAIFYRSLFLDYGKYAQTIQKVFSTKNNAVDSPKDINMVPDDFYFLNFDGSNGYRVSISKSRTDIFYYEEREQFVYNEDVNDFFKRIGRFIDIIFKDYNICSRIGIINTSLFFVDEPIQFISDRFCKNKFTKMPSQLSISYNIQDTFKDMLINQIFNIQEQTYTHKHTAKEYKAGEVKLDINTNGFQEKLDNVFLDKFFNKYKNNMKKESIEAQINGK